MRVSRHNGRSGSHGTYNSKHNDREFDVKNAEGIGEDMTQFNIYWNCIDGRCIRHSDLGETNLSFTEAEKNFYSITYGDYVKAQNERNIAARHKERCRTTDQLREDPKTCPEETIYQIGNINEHVDPEVLLNIATEFFGEIDRRFGEHVHTLNWALHMDESTPHIHERHVFDVTNQYGEICPKQEQALKALGFDFPDPAKKSGRYNNRKMSYDSVCRELFIGICKEHGIEIEEEPIYGGKSYLEKEEYIREKLKDDISTMQEKLDDEEAFVNEISEKAYNKALETLIEPIVERVSKEHDASIESRKQWLMSKERTSPKDKREFAVKHLDGLRQSIANAKSRIISAIRNAFGLPEKKKEFVKEIAKEIRPSITKRLERAKEQAREYNMTRAVNDITDRRDRSYER